MILNRFYRLSAVMAATLLCFNVGQADSADEFAKIHTVGVISGFENTMTFKKIGVMVFGNSEEKISIADWNINATVSDDISAALRNKFIVKPVANDAATFTEESKDFRNWKQKRFVSLPENNAIDAYIMILPSGEMDPLGSSLNIEGLGFLNHERIFGSPKLALYAIYKVYIVDAKTGARIDYGSARVHDSAFLSSASPYAPMEESAWPASVAQLSTEEKIKLKDQLIALIQKSLPYAFLNANLPLQ
jgi:hypothetical protein